MLKPKSRSLIITEPLEQELQTHIALLEQRQLQLMRERLQRQQEKQERVQALQKEFVQWADKKQYIIRSKLEKSTKNKEEHLNKIVKKCKDHEKYIGEKLRTFKSKRRDNMKQAWKKAEQFNNQMEQHHSKNISKQHSAHKISNQHHLSQSRLVGKQNTNYDREPQRQYLSISYNNASKIIGNSNFMGNLSKDYWNELNQSIRPLKMPVPEQVGQSEQQDRQKAQHAHNKLKQTLARFRQNVEAEQQLKIQQLGQRLHKIQQSRIKKLQLYKKRTSTNPHTLENEDDRRRPAKKKQERSERLQSQSAMRQKRAQDWAQPNRQKRDELFQMQLQHGTEYLEHHKLKYMKNALTRKIAGSAIQKKLYFERLNH